MFLLPSNSASIPQKACSMRRAYLGTAPSLRFGMPLTVAAICSHQWSARTTQTCGVFQHVYGWH